MKSVRLFTICKAFTIPQSRLNEVPIKMLRTKVAADDDWRVVATAVVVVAIS